MSINGLWKIASGLTDLFSLKILSAHLSGIFSAVCLQEYQMNPEHRINACKSCIEHEKEREIIVNENVRSKLCLSVQLEPCLTFSCAAVSSSLWRIINISNQSICLEAVNSVIRDSERDPMSSLFFSKNISMSLLTDSLCFIKNRLEKSVWNKVSLKCTAPVYIFFLFVCKLKNKILNHAIISFCVI